MKIYIGIDNGVSGSLAFMRADGVVLNFLPMPTFSEQDYIKEKRNITRVDTNALYLELAQYADTTIGEVDALVVMERPMVNPMRFRASVSALRALEAVLVTVESLKLPRMYCDSRDWQKTLLPGGCKGEELKLASRDIGTRLYPKWERVIHKQKDADALLIAEWARRTKL